MAGRFVIDTNWLGDSSLADFLSRSAANFAVISEMTLVEVHKDAAAKNGRKLLQTLCRYPRQVILLRGTHDLYRDSGASKRLCNRLIEPVQTANFGAYCRTVIDVADDEMTDAHFSLMEEQSRDQIADLRANVANILTLFERCLPIFEKGDLDRLRKRIPYSGDLQRKLIQRSYGALQCHRHVAESLPRERGTTPDRHGARFRNMNVWPVPRSAFWLRKGS